MTKCCGPDARLWKTQTEGVWCCSVCRRRYMLDEHGWQVPVAEEPEITLGQCLLGLAAAAILWAMDCLMPRGW